MGLTGFFFVVGFFGVGFFSTTAVTTQTLVRYTRTQGQVTSHTC